MFPPERVMHQSSLIIKLHIFSKSVFFAEMVATKPTSRLYTRNHQNESCIPLGQTPVIQNMSAYLILDSPPFNIPSLGLLLRQQEVLCVVTMETSNCFYWNSCHLKVFVNTYTTCNEHVHYMCIRGISSIWGKIFSNLKNARSISNISLQIGIRTPVYGYNDTFPKTYFFLNSFSPSLVLNLRCW
jgi:hypothetical protein